MRNLLLNRIWRLFSVRRPSDLAPRKATTRKLSFFIALASFPLLSRAANITLQGTFTADDNVQLFSVSIAAPAAVDIRSYGYAGGTTSTGTVVPRGGFDTILTLFDGTGAFLADNDEGAGVALDPSTGLAADARITDNLATGSYIVALTQYDNFSIGNLADGFAEAGHPNFTADPTFTTGGPCPGNVFRDISGTSGRCRTGNWTVDFVNVASVTTVPEPSALLLLGIGFALLLVGRFRDRKKLSLLAGGLVAALASVPVQAQTNSGPDYSQVPDFLNGQRSLLNVTDLEIVRNSALITQITTSNSSQTVKADFGFPVASDNTKTARNFSARMFNQPQGITLTPLYSDSNLALFMLYVQGIASLSNGVQLWTPLPDGYAPDLNGGAVADFTLDGYDDLALSFATGELLVVAPNDVNDATKGFRKSLATLDVLSDMAAGDFNGNGQREIAGLTVLPSGGLKLVIYTVDPNSLAIARASSLILTTPDTPITHVSMARGRFNSVGHDQLAVAFATDTDQVRVEVIDFAPNSLNASEGPQVTPTLPGIMTSGGYFEVKTGKFGLPGNPYDQIVFHNSTPQAVDARFFEILKVDPTSLTISGTSPLLYDHYGCSAGIQVGNFDHRQADPSNPSQTQPNLNAQIAFMYCNGQSISSDSSKTGYTMNIYSVDPQSLNVQGLPDSELKLNGYDLVVGDSISFVPVDLQGRSVTLGEPTKITIGSTIQPSVAIGAPPMHVDFVSPDPFHNAAPTVLNLSAVPDGFKTTYDQEDSTGNASSSTNGTSWSFGAKESVTGGVAVGDPDISGEKVSDTATAAQNLKGSSETVHGTYQGKTFNLSATTGFGDEVSYVDSQFNIWVYPVLGKTVCPAAKPNCQPSEQVPLTIQFSAPSGDALTHATQGQALQWYQPPWEPGNIFSYPANLGQLQSIYPDLSQLTNGVEFLTDTSEVTQRTAWSVTTKDTASTSLKQNYSFENDFSFSGSISEGVAREFAGLDFDLSGSFGFNSLIKSTTTLGLSTGIRVSKPGTFPTFQNYGYSVTPYIMGTTQPGGVVDNQALSGDVRTFGLLRAMFTADPLASDAGSWWQQAYSQAPDVALNHPSRWAISALGLANPVPGNCLATGTGLPMDCAELNPRSPDNPWLSVFHQMRGFFISSAASPGQGPQLAQAKTGDLLRLQARVYNYSLKAMPSGSEVHVRFYFQPMNGTLPAGDSVLIGEDVRDPIPPFSDTPGAPLNWVLAGTTFDTSQYDQTKNGNAYLLFWVVVWIQDSNGNLVPEMPGHGLTRIPGTLNSLTDVAEECQSDGNCYSNNLGLYHQIFYIASPTLGVVPGPLPESTLVDIGKAEVSARRITPKDNVVVSATLLAIGADASGISANFYDGDPQLGGRLFDVEQIPHIAQNESYPLQTLYRTNTCGEHQLFVVVNAGKPSEVVRRAPPVRVDCKATR